MGAKRQTELFGHEGKHLQYYDTYKTNSLLPKVYYKFGYKTLFSVFTLKSRQGQVQIPMPQKSKVWQDEYKTLGHIKDWSQRLPLPDIFNHLPILFDSCANTESLTPGNRRVAQLVQMQCRTPVYYVVHNVGVPVGRKSKRSRVVSLNVEILDYYVLEKSLHSDCVIFQLNIVLHNCSHSLLLPSDIYRSYY